MTDHQGIIFPLYEEVIDRAISERKDVFVKFSNRKVESGMTLYLYETGEQGSRKIVARATVTDSQKLKPSKVRKEFGDQIFQSKEDFDEYTRGRGNKKMLVVETEGLERLDDPVEAVGNITVSGLYLDQEQVDRLEDKINS